MRGFLLIALVWFCSSVQAQVTPPPTPETNPENEEQLEMITENNEDAETEDDAFLQQMVQFLENPINLNKVSTEDLNALHILTPMQVHSLVQYRQLFGNLLSVYEAQAIPGWDVATLERLKPYITVQQETRVASSIASRLRNGESTLLLRATQVLEKSKGYLLDSTTANNYYPGSPQRLFIRYKYNYKNLLQYGFVAEKDPGEEFFKGSQKQGFDYYSFHFYARDIGIIKTLALGDYTVNLGQGLTQWMSLAFKKGPDISSIKRQSATIRPYNSAGEINFHRGAAITLAKNKWEVTVFGSYKKIDANFVPADTTLQIDDLVSSFQTSGYHRTNSELADKKIQRQIAFGGNISYRFKNGLHLGLNGIHYNFKLPLVKAADPYNLYSLTGTSFGNYSFDYGYTYRNMHLFGEFATTDKQYKAMVQGLMISLSHTVDMSLLYRNISPGYQALYTSAFTESTYPNNEKGLFAGISIKPDMVWRIDAYMDLYKFPWLKYRVNAPSTGSEYMVQVTYKPNRVLEIYTRLRSETKSINYNPDGLTLNPVVPQPRQNWRAQLSYKINPIFTFRTRTEMLWYDKKGPAAENGFLMYADLLYKPLMNPLAGSIRLQYFETDGYNSRLYAYENDVLYSYSIPVFYDKGYRWYINANYDVSRRMTVWFRFSQSILPGKQSIGTGLDEIKGNKKSEVKLQLRYIFGKK